MENGGTNTSYAPLFDVSTARCRWSITLKNLTASQPFFIGLSSYVYVSSDPSAGASTRRRLDVAMLRTFFFQDYFGSWR